MYGILKRKYLTANTIGELSLYDKDNNLLYSCKTVELKWANNVRRESCIPENEYTVSVVGPTAKIKYEHLWVENVPDRDGIKIHIANYSKQLLGCIAPGLTHADLDKDNLIDVSNSTVAMNKIMAVVKEQGIKSFKLKIQNGYEG